MANLSTFDVCIAVGAARGWERPISREGLRKLAGRLGIVPAVAGRRGVSAQWAASDLPRLKSGRPRTGKGKR